MVSLHLDSVIEELAKGNLSLSQAKQLTGIPIPVLIELREKYIVLNFNLYNEVDEIPF